MAWVYILKTETGKYYIGSTSDLKRRVKNHFSGQTPTTKRLRTESVIFTQEYPTLKEARTIEKKIKNLKRRDYIEKIVKDGYIKITPKV